MKLLSCAVFLGFFTLLAFTPPVLAQQSAAQPPAGEESSYIDEEGTAYITRIVPVPQTISPEAQKSLARQATHAASHEPPPPKKPQPVQSKQMSSDATRAVYPANIEFSTMAGVPVSVVTPPVIPANKANRVLINLHGGGFTSDSGSLTASLPIANLTPTRAVSVVYRLGLDHRL